MGRGKDGGIIMILGTVTMRLAENQYTCGNIGLNLFYHDEPAFFTATWKTQKSAEEIVDSFRTTGIDDCAEVTYLFVDDDSISNYEHGFGLHFSDLTPDLLEYIDKGRNILLRIKDVADRQVSYEVEPSVGLRNVCYASGRFVPSKLYTLIDLTSNIPLTPYCKHEIGAIIKQRIPCD